MTRDELYGIIAENKLQEPIKKKFGRPFSSCSNNDLEDFISKIPNIKTIVATKVENTKKSNSKQEHNTGYKPKAGDYVKGTCGKKKVLGVLGDPNAGPKLLCLYDALEVDDNEYFKIGGVSPVCGRRISLIEKSSCQPCNEREIGIIESNSGYDKID